jgi:hypothetical protein
MRRILSLRANTQTAMKRQGLSVSVTGITTQMTTPVSSPVAAKDSSSSEVSNTLGIALGAGLGGGLGALVLICTAICMYKRSKVSTLHAVDIPCFKSKKFRQLISQHLKHYSITDDLVW